MPRSKAVRGFSYFGVSFVYIIFEDGTDIYWARNRVLEYLHFAQKDLPTCHSASTRGTDAQNLRGPRSSAHD